MTRTLALVSLLVGSLNGFAMGGAGGRTVLTCTASAQQIKLDVQQLTGLTGGRPGSFIATLTEKGRWKAITGVAAFNDTQFHGYRAADGSLSVKISHIQPMDLAWPFVRGTVEFKDNGAVRSMPVRCNQHP